MSEKLVCTTPNRPYMIASNGLKMVIFQPRCKMWSCPACAILNRDGWKFKVYDSACQLIEAGRPLFFLTITSHENAGANTSLWAWPDAWKKLRSRAAYHAGGSFPYLMIPEKHKDGRLHVHLIETSGLGTRWWKDHPRRCGLGYQNEEVPVWNEDGAVWYVTKYLNKSMGDTGAHWPKGFRRIRTSQSWPKPRPTKTEHEFRFELVKKKDSLVDIRDRAYMDGLEVVMCDHNTAWLHVDSVSEKE